MVNTFVLGTYEYTATTLDNKRLGKQRVEARMIINIILQLEAGLQPKGWVNHPATKMWLGYVENLKLYFNIMVNEWISRGKVNTMPYYELHPIKSFIAPYWASWTALHHSHMASLMRKDTTLYYDKFTYPYVYNLFGYVWPSKLSLEITNKLSETIMPLDIICEPISKSVTAAEARRREYNRDLYYSICISQYYRDYNCSLHQ